MLAGQHTVRDSVMKKVEGRDSHMKLSHVLYMHPCPHWHVLLQSYTYSLNNKPKPNPSSTVASREGSAFTEGMGHPQNPAFYSVQLHGSYMYVSFTFETYGDKCTFRYWKCITQYFMYLCLGFILCWIYACQVELNHVYTSRSFPGCIWRSIGVWKMKALFPFPCPSHGHLP